MVARGGQPWWRGPVDHGGSKPPESVAVSLRQTAWSAYVTIGRMTVATIVLDYLKTLIWPIVLLVFIVRFAPTIRRVLENLSELSGPAGITARFEHEVNRTAAQADLAASVEQDRSRASPDASTSDSPL